MSRGRHRVESTPSSQTAIPRFGHTARWILTVEGGQPLFQCRQDSSQYFFLYWTDYENGFGDLSHEFWLGLAQIHRLTASTARTELRVDLECFSSVTRYAQYTDFGIGDASSNYVLTVAGYSVIITISNFQPGTVTMKVVVVYTVHKTVWEAGGKIVVPFPV